MEERSNKTIMCSVLFLDIVEYSKKSVSGQISLKERFNSYLSEAILDVPVTDRIILDTGDGAAINFLGDVEDALKAALSVRENLLNEDPEVDYPLLVRMGINLGPVRLVRDINGQPNIVGDGINVAQRIMGFADAAQILVSRSYYDAVSRLSPHYAGMFHYQGSRTDKHVREHEVYAIGYPGDKTTLKGGVTARRASGASESASSGAVRRVQDMLETTVSFLQILQQNWVERYREAEPKQRVVYIGVIAAPILLLLVLLVSLAGHKEAPVVTGGVEEVQPKDAVSEKFPDTDVSAKESAVTSEADKTDTGKTVQKEKPVSVAGEKSLVKPKAKPKTSTKIPVEQSKPSAQKQDNARPEAKPAIESTEARITVNCTAGTEVFVDGVRKGSVGSRPLSVIVDPGTHTVIISHTSGGIYSQEVKLSSGRTVEVRPNFCK